MDGWFSTDLRHNILLVHRLPGVRLIGLQLFLQFLDGDVELNDDVFSRLLNKMLGDPSRPVRSAAGVANERLLLKGH